MARRNSGVHRFSTDDFPDRDKASVWREHFGDAIAKMDDGDRALCGRLHEIITEAAPELAPRTWYGMPAYARDGKVVCFFQPAGKFKARYATLGFSDQARLDDGNMWPNSFAITRLTQADEARIAALVKQAVG